MSGADAERSLEVRRVVSVAGALLVVEVAEPVPIGTRVVLRLADVAPAGAGLGPLHGKVTDVRRAPDAFSVTLRLHSVTRAQREAIAALA